MPKGIITVILTILAGAICICMNLLILVGMFTALDGLVFDGIVTMICSFIICARCGVYFENSMYSFLMKPST